MSTLRQVAVLRFRDEPTTFAPGARRRLAKLKKRYNGIFQQAAMPLRALAQLQSIRRLFLLFVVVLVFIFFVFFFVVVVIIVVVVEVVVFFVVELVVRVVFG